MFDLIRRHLLLDLFLADRRVGVAADGAEHVPHIGAHQVGLRQPGANLVIPAHARLRPGMPFHRGAQVPFEGADLVLLDPEPQGVHHADQFFCLGIARPGRGPKRLAGLLKAACFHQVARLFQLRPSREGQKKSDTKSDGIPMKIRRKSDQLFHALLLLLGLAVPAAALDLPDPLTDADFIQFDPDQAQLGQLLFYDKLLSGNQNISCGTCHHHEHGSSDGLSLGIGEGGVGLGPDRTPGEGRSRIHARIPRNAPALWNLAHRDIDTLFHDGRLSKSDLFGNEFNSPAEEFLPTGLNSILAAQALFPMTAEHEMAGNPGENEVAGAVKDRVDKAWPIIAKHVRMNPGYGQMFVAAFDHIEAPEDVTIVDIVNAIAAFIGTEFRSDNSAFDAYLKGNTNALNPQEMRGMELFYSVGCSGCHAGPLLSDQAFHDIGLPQFGPGRTRKWDPMPRDVGRMSESDDLEDAYRFRTPSLRNIALTAPYGHNGAMPTLDDMVRHHADPRLSQQSWRPQMASLRPVSWLEKTDFIIRSDRIEMERQLARVEVDLPGLTDQDITDIVAFLNCLTDKSDLSMPLGVPKAVPSGLPVD